MAVVGIRREDLQEDTAGDEVYIPFAEQDSLVKCVSGRFHS
jgi:hypothetical protein